MVTQSKLFSPNKTLLIAGKVVDLSTQKVMGILNVTPDSFYDGGRYTRENTYLQQAEKMIVEGADFIDVGGYSTRPGASEVSVNEELARVIPVINSIKKEFPFAVISIDTFRASVAKAAVEEGAGMINDISAGELDAAMYETVSALQVPYVTMHLRGTPQTMTQFTTYEYLLKEVLEYFHRKLYQLNTLGIKDVIIDPGFGFAKMVDQNFELLNNLERLHILEKPILVGLSRKSMIWRTLKITPEAALNGTTALNTLALLKGASILRVHDVKEAKEVIQLMSNL
ncbi:MAG: dihydropteroate synthase [Cyclobacteriaceae bacterium]|nr:dihydropteroate synthase [Cyclobacteriaceae bacterium]